MAIQTAIHGDLRDGQILNPDRSISESATLFFVNSLGLYVYAGDAVCFELEDLGARDSAPEIIQEH